MFHFQFGSDNLLFATSFTMAAAMFWDFPLQAAVLCVAN